jgi:hypothetical protein
LKAKKEKEADEKKSQIETTRREAKEKEDDAMAEVNGELKYF